MGNEFPGTHVQVHGLPNSKQRLTEAMVGSIAASDRDQFLFDTLESGFAIRVTPKGTKLFLAQVRVGGAQRRVTVGRFPDMTVIAARKAAREALDALREGRDPGLDRAARAQAERAGQTTVADLGKRWMREVVKPKRKPRTADDYQRLIDQKIDPAFGHKSVAAVTRDDVEPWHAKMAKTPRRANYALATFKALMNFGEVVGLRPSHTNPCRKIEFFREGKRERFLTEAEIAKAADAIATVEASGKIGPHAAAGLRLALFTGARSGEVTAAKWSHLDHERKLIRLPDSKTNEPRTIHLSDAAMAVLSGLERVEPYIVAGAKKGEAYKNLGRAWIIVRETAGLDDVRLHDLRHSYASLAAGRGVSLQMIGKLLGHKVPATTQRYAHLARDAVTAVNDDLGAAMTAAIDRAKRPNAKVLKMRKRRAAR